VSGEPESLTPPWAYYRRTGLSEMRPYVPKEPLATISVSAPDMDTITRALTEGRDPGGYVARNPKNHADQWYVAQAYFNENLEPADTPARDDAAELRAALREWSEANRACSQWVAGTGGNDQDELPLARLSRAERHLHALAASEGQP